MWFILRAVVVQEGVVVRARSAAEPVTAPDGDELRSFPCIIAVVAAGEFERSAMENEVNAYLLGLAQHALMTAIVCLVGHAWRLDIGAESERRRIHGRYVFWWMVAAYCGGGLIGLLLAGTYSSSGVGIFPLFCMLCGWLVGTLHGAVALFTIKNRNITIQELDKDAEPTAAPDGDERS